MDTEEEKEFGELKTGKYNGQPKCLSKDCEL